MRQLVVTADDFGLSLPVNAAIERAHRDGILTAASLMVGGSAAADAVERARRMPSLKVGLHVVVTRARPVLSAETIPELVDADGRLPHGLVGCGVRYFFRARVRRQLEREIRAQFEAFRTTGLDLDHVDAHNHLHLHPTVFAMILALGPGYGMRAVRLPYEPPLLTWRGAGDGLPARLANSVLLGPWVQLMARRVRRAGLISNRYLFGLHDTGRMDTRRVLRLLAQVPRGISEIYFHPAVAGPRGARPLPDPGACAAELAALLSAEVRAALAAHDIHTTSFSAIAARQA